MYRTWQGLRIRAISTIAFLFLSVLLSQPTGARQKELRIAAAADLQFAMPELVRKFEKQTGANVVVSYGSSGNFFAQIQNGAPFDVFFSADISYPRKLNAVGLCEPGSLFPYAFGRIVIWVSSASRLDVSALGWKTLLDPRVQTIAIANPAYAPYGKAAIAALKSAGIYDRVRGKLVYGENISQTAQFVQSGNAQAGILALSLVHSPAMRGGQHWEIPQSLYPPLEQGSMILKTSTHKALARSFLQFVQGPMGRAILESLGFQTRIEPLTQVGN